MPGPLSASQMLRDMLLSLTEPSATSAIHSGLGGTPADRPRALVGRATSTLEISSTVSALGDISAQAAIRSAPRLSRNVARTAFFDCFCEARGRCFPPRPNGLRQCPPGYHVDPDACKRRRVYHYIAPGGCARPIQVPQEPWWEAPTIQVPGEKPRDPPVKQSECDDLDKPVKHFKQHDKEFGDKGHVPTCQEMWEEGACYDKKRPALGKKVREECPCTCGRPKVAPKPGSDPPVDPTYTNDLERNDRCNYRGYDVWNHLKLLDDHGRIIVDKIDDRIDRSLGVQWSCGVNQSYRRPFAPCLKAIFLLMGEANPPAIPNFHTGCFGNPVYDAGVRIESELVEVDGDQYEWKEKWGADVLRHLDKNKCHDLVFQGPNAFLFRYLGCIITPDIVKSKMAWAPEMCKGMESVCSGKDLCCVKHKSMEHSEGSLIKTCGSDLCKPLENCDRAPEKFKDTCLSQVVNLA